MFDVKKKLQEAKADLDNEIFGTQGDRFYDGKPSLPRAVVIAQVLGERAWRALAANVVCRIFGHDEESWGCGSPNSGYEHIGCARCKRTMASGWLY